MLFIYAIIALLITFILVPVLIPTLKRMKFGQSIREEGPQSHMKKTGTPTMGGLKNVTPPTVYYTNLTLPSKERV